MLTTSVNERILARDLLPLAYQVEVSNPPREPLENEYRWVIYNPANSLTTSREYREMLYDYRPRTELGRRLLELRRKYIAGGGRLLSEDEIEIEIRSRRGGVMDE